MDTLVFSAVSPHLPYVMIVCEGSVIDEKINVSHLTRFGTTSVEQQ